MSILWKKMLVGSMSSSCCVSIYVCPDKYISEGSSCVEVKGNKSKKVMVITQSRSPQVRVEEEIFHTVKDQVHCVRNPAGFSLETSPAFRGWQALDSSPGERVQGAPRGRGVHPTSRIPIVGKTKLVQIHIRSSACRTH